MLVDYKGREWPAANWPNEDLVFREIDGALKLVGDFEGLYRVEPDPWEQSGQGRSADYYRASRCRLVAGLRALINGHDIAGLEVGCGHGHVTDLLRTATHSERSNWDGVDISPSAIARATKLYPDCYFFVDDITKPGIQDITRISYYDVVVIGHTLWYILHALRTSLNNCYGLLRPDGLLVISQAFLEHQRYGSEFVDGFAGLLRLFVNDYSDQFRVIQASYDDTNRFGKYRDGLLILRKV